MAWGLTVRIFQHLFDEGWLKEGDLVADPFGGIGSTGLAGASFGCPCILVELEEKFCTLAEQNFELHREQWERMGKPYPVIVQGDSRQFSFLIREAVDSIITSPPFGSDNANLLGRTDKSAISIKATTGMRGVELSANNIGAMKEGNCAEVIDGIITSPPYTNVMSSEKSGIDWSKCKREDGKPRDMTKESAHATRIGAGGEMRYSPDSANMGNLPEGSHEAVVDAVVTSPPFQKSEGMQDKKWFVKHRGEFGGGGVMGEYALSASSIGNKEGETYWVACRDVYCECLQALKPGGVMAVVVKAFVRNRQIVDLPSQTLGLLEAIGFKPLERIRAWMISPATQKSLMPELVGDYVKAKKSFFRRLAERKGSPRIDFEQVLVVRKPT